MSCSQNGWWTTDKISQLDFSSGNVLYLSDLKVESQSWTPYLDTPIAAEALAKMFGPRIDRTRSEYVTTYVYLSFEEFEPGSLVIASWDKFAPLYYHQQVHALRPDLTVTDAKVE